MSIPALLAIAALASMAANALHRRSRGEGLPSHHTTGGLLRFGFIIGTAATAVAAILVLASVLSPSVFLAIAMGMVIVSEISSLIRRISNG